MAAIRFQKGATDKSREDSRFRGALGLRRGRFAFHGRKRPQLAMIFDRRIACQSGRTQCVGMWFADKRIIANIASGMQRWINRQKPMRGAMSIYNSMKPSIARYL